MHRRYNTSNSRAAEPRNAPFWVVALALLALAAANPSFLAAQSDEGVERTPSLAGGFRFYPGSLWSSTMGVGIGVGYQFRNLTGPTSSLLLVAKPSIHRGIYELSYLTRDPYREGGYGGLAIYYEDTGRTLYYGTGPFSDDDARVYVKDRLLRTRVRAGMLFGDGRWVLQPVGEFWLVAPDSFRNDDAGAYEAMNDASRLPLQAAVLHGPIRFASVGLDIGRFFSLDPRRAGSSAQASIERFIPASEGFGGFWRVSAALELDERVGTRQFFGRVAFASVVGSAEDVPYFLLPRLGGRLLPGYARFRFRGKSMLVLNAGVEQPLFNLLGFGGVDLVAMVGAGSVYDDLPDQFTFRVSFQEGVLSGSRAPLRPAVAAGVRLYAGERPYELTVLGGLSPERMSVVTFTLHRDIRHHQGLLFR